MKQYLEGRVAIVTGAGRGVGREVALLYARQGARVVCADNGSQVDGSRPSGGPAHEVVEEIQKEGGEAIADIGDVSDWSCAQGMVAKAINTWGKLDILANIAGNFISDTVANVEEERLSNVVKVHTLGMAATSHFAAKHWKERREYGRLINVTSDSAMSGVPDTFSYAAAKAGIIGLTRSVANAMVNYGVTANMLTQGSSTRMGESYMKEALEKFPDMERPLMDPSQTPANVAPLLVYLASPQAAQITGRIFGAYARRYVLWSEPTHVADLVSSGDWDVDYLFEHFGESLGKGLSLDDLIHPMEDMDLPPGVSLQALSKPVED